jgi:imidazolonepropionase-like amidohydrolase
MKGPSNVHFVIDYEPDDTACVELKNGRIVDVANADYLDERVKLIVKGKRIEAMPGGEGPSDGIKADFVIDLKGKTVLPGLFNTHCHTTYASPTLLPDFKDVKLLKTYAEKQIEKNMAECLIHGITNIRDAWAADLRKVRSLRERIRKNELAGPRIMQCVVVGPPGGYLTQKHGLIMRWARSRVGVPAVDFGLEYSGSVEFALNATEQQVRDAVDRAIDERGAQGIKIGEQKENMTNFKPDATIMTMNQLRAIAGQSRRRNLKSTLHHTSVASFRRALEAGVSSLAHIAGDELLTEDDLALLSTHDCIIEPTLSIPYGTGYKIKGHRGFDDPYMALLTEFRQRVHDDIVQEYWIPEFKARARLHHRKASSEKMKIFKFLPMRAMFEHFAFYCTMAVRNLGILFRAGAPMAASNDGGVPPCTVAMVQHEISLLHLFLNRACGEDLFSGADAVRMATINGAKCLGLEEDFGSIETGKVADLVIIDGDPLKDHRLVGGRVAALFKDGRLVINNCNLQVMASGKI